MWLAGVVLLLLFTAGVALSLDRQRRQVPPLPLWDIPRVAGTYTTIVGTLSGFSVASAVLIANLARGTPAFDETLALFIFAFLLLISATMQFGTTPNLGGTLTDRYLSDQHLSYVFANAAFYIGVSLSWLGLRLMLLALEVERLADFLTWVLLFSVIAGAIRIAMHLYRHTTIAAAACFAVPFIAFGLAAVYRLGLAELWPALWPDSDQPMLLGVVAFFVGGLGYMTQSVLLTLHGNPAFERRVTAYGPRWLLAFCQAVVTTVALVWFAVAEA